MHVLVVESMDSESYCVGFSLIPPLICSVTLGRLCHLYLCFLIYKLMCQLSSDALQDPLTILHHPAQCPGNLTFLDGHPWLFWPVKGTTRMWEGGNQGMSRYLVPSRGAVGWHGWISLGHCLLSCNVGSFWVLEPPLLNEGWQPCPIWLTPGCSSIVCFPFSVPIILSSAGPSTAYFRVYHPFPVVYRFF